MRLRRKKWADPYLEENNELVIKESEELSSSWNYLFGNDNPLRLEIGMGKGDFIIGVAALNKDINFIGIEHFSTVCAIASKKINETEGTENIRTMCYDAVNLEKVIAPKSLDAIYLNFSDPWPKKRHAKRRLTSPAFLSIYMKLLKDDGKIIMKTDNDGLFEYSVETIPTQGWKIIECTTDYQFDETCDAMSEYERRFRSIGKNINRLVAVKE